jgi:hypothetical protein
MSERPTVRVRGGGAMRVVYVEGDYDGKPWYMYSASLGGWRLVGKFGSRDEAEEFALRGGGDGV